MVSRRRMRVQWLGCMPGGKAIVLTQVHGILALSAAAARGGGERGIKPLLQLQNPFSALAGCVDYEAIINTCPRQHTNTNWGWRADWLAGWRTCVRTKCTMNNSLPFFLCIFSFRSF